MLFSCFPCRLPLVKQFPVQVFFRWDSRGSIEIEVPAGLSKVLSFLRLEGDQNTVLRAWSAAGNSVLLIYTSPVHSTSFLQFSLNYDSYVCQC